MENKKEKIDAFLEMLKKQSVNDTSDVGEFGSILEKFAITCKKCGSLDVFVSWEQGCDYGGYTGYSSGQKLFKCMGCGSSASFWE